MSRLTFLDLASEQQGHLLDLPFDGRYLISGLPGAGKTLLAIHRAVMLDIAGRDVVLLTYSNVLRQYITALAARLEFGGTITTCHRWFDNLWMRRFQEKAPKVEDKVGLDWTQMITRLARSQTILSSEIEALVVDEGQDLPKGFYSVCSQVAANATVFADDHQRIGEDQSTLKEIGQLLGQGTERRHIVGNHRNTRQIAEFANHFYCGTESRAPTLPSREGQIPTIQRYRTANLFTDTLATYVRENPGQEIGVVLQHQQQCISLLDKLHNRGIRNAQTYASGSPHFQKVNFDSPGVRIFSPASIKGQEFDTLFMPNLEFYGGDISSAALRMEVHGLATRAANGLHLSYETEREPELTRDVPESILARLGT